MEATHRLRPFMIAILALAIFAGVAPAATAPSPEGVWNGTVKVPGNNLDYKLTLTATDSGLVGTVDIPVQGAFGLPTVGLRATADSLIFGLKGVPGNPTYYGAFSADGDSVAGNFSQGGATFPFAMSRAGAAEVQKQSADLSATLDGLRHFIDSARQVLKVPGVGVAILKGNNVVMSEGFGYRDLADTLPVTSQTLFPIGSSTKAFTTMALAMLVDDGKVDWDAKVRTYLPAFALKDEFASDRVTVRDLITHRTGLPRHDLVWYGSDFSRDDLIRRIAYLQADKEFRTTFQYQNLMFLTAGVLAGKVNGTTWEELIKSRILDPLGMNATDFSVTDLAKAPDRALGYGEDHDTLKLLPYRNADDMAPAGAINSNLDDMAKWVKLFLDKGKVGHKRLVSEAEVTELYTCQIPIGRPGPHTERLLPGYGLGWFVEAYRGHYRVQHGGNIDGFSALVSFLPYDGIGIVVLTNKNGSQLPGVVSLTATDRLLGLDPVDWLGRAEQARQKADSALKASEANEEAGRIKGTKTSHKLADYVGEYENPGYGVIKVSLKNNKLQAAFHTFNWSLEHWHYDVFKATDTVLRQDMLIEFFANVKGDIDRLSAPLEPAVDPIVFKRKASSELSSPEYLKRFVGTFELSGTEVTVALSGDRLTLTVPSQPTYTLSPYKENEFNLKGLSGYSVVFKADSKGVVTAAEFHQPNGIFTAQRTTEK